MPAPFGERTYRTPSRSQDVKKAIAHLKSNPREQLVIGSAVRTFNQFGDEMQATQEEATKAQVAQEAQAQATQPTQTTQTTEEETKEETTKEQPTCANKQYDEGGCTSITFWGIFGVVLLVVLALCMCMWAVISTKDKKINESNAV